MAECVSCAGHEMCIKIRFVLYEAYGCVDELTEGPRHVIGNTAPEISRLKSLHFEGRDNPEIVQATPQGCPKIGMLVVVGVHDFTRRENNLETNDRITRETLAG